MMKTALKILSVVLLMIATTPCFAQESYNLEKYRQTHDAKVWKVFESYLGQTRTLLEQGKYTEALERYRQMVTGSDGHALNIDNRACYAAYAGIVYCYMKLGQIDKAAAHMDKYLGSYLDSYKFNYIYKHPKQATLNFVLGSERYKKLQAEVLYYKLLSYLKTECQAPILETFSDWRDSYFSSSSLSSYASLSNYPEEKQAAAATILYYLRDSYPIIIQDIESKVPQTVLYYCKYSINKYGRDIRQRVYYDSHQSKIETSSRIRKPEDAAAAWIRLQAMGMTDPRKVFADYPDIMPLICYFEAAHILNGKDEERYPDALSYLDTHARLLPEMAEKEPVKLTTARLLYELGYYKDALDIFVLAKSATNDEIVNAQQKHLYKLKLWNLTEEEAVRRNGAGSWRSFYDSQEISHKENLAYASQQRQQVDARRKAEAKPLAVEYKKRIMPYVADENWDEADRLATQGLREIYGGDAYLYYVQARAYFNRHFSGFIEGERDDFSAFFKAYQSEASRLENLCTNSIRCDSDGTNEAYFYRGQAYIIMGQTNDAASDFRRYMSGVPSSRSSCYYNIGIAYKNAARYKDALENFKQAQQYTDNKAIIEDCMDNIKECQDKIDKKE